MYELVTRIPEEYGLEKIPEEKLKQCGYCPSLHIQLKNRSEKDNMRKRRYSSIDFKIIAEGTMEQLKIHRTVCDILDMLYHTKMDILGRLYDDRHPEIRR